MRADVRCATLVAALCVLAAGCAPGPATQRPAIVAGGHAHAEAGSGPLMSMGSCRPSDPPIGAVPPVPPAWCSTLRSGIATSVSGPNSWVDAFDSGAEMTAFPAGYAVFENARPSIVLRSRHFAHNGHWMVDVAGRDDDPALYEGDPRDLEAGTHYGGALVRPDRTFRFVDGRLIVEFEVAAGMLAYHDAWPEIVVTTAAAPTGTETDPLHAIGIFGGAPAVGCRLYTDRTSSCSAYDGSGRALDEGGRIFQLSAERGEGAATHRGGAPLDPALAAAWRVCEPTDPDTVCRDRFRLEIGSDALRLFANGVLYMEASGLPAAKRVPAALVDGAVYVYFASWVYLARPDTVRFHWGRLAINP